MKKISFILALIFSAGLLDAAPYWRVKSSTTGATTAELSGDFQVFNSTASIVPTASISRGTMTANYGDFSNINADINNLYVSTAALDQKINNETAIRAATDQILGEATGYLDGAYVALTIDLANEIIRAVGRENSIAVTTGTINSDVQTRLKKSADSQLSMGNYAIVSSSSISANKFIGGTFHGDGSGLTGITLSFSTMTLTEATIADMDILKSGGFNYITTNDNIVISPSRTIGAGNPPYLAIERGGAYGNSFDFDLSTGGGASRTDTMLMSRNSFAYDFGPHVNFYLKVSSAARIEGKLIVSTITASRFYGDGSGLTNLPSGVGDNLGNHTATTTLNMANFPIANVSTLTASAIIAPVKNTWRVVYSTITAANASSFNIVGLSGGTYSMFKLSGRLRNSSAITVAYGLRFNADMAANYGSQIISAEAAVVTSSRTTTETLIPRALGAAITTGISTFDASIISRAGEYRTARGTSSSEISATSNRLDVVTGVWANSADAISQINIIVPGSPANCIGAGSVIILEQLLLD